jgi:2-hydroxy-6-oxonona-2,4-dienedioate hydrolase
MQQAAGIAPAHRAGATTLMGGSELKTATKIVDGKMMFFRFSEKGGGSGRPPVVFVHGLSVSSRYFIPTAEVLAEDYPVFAPDLPGFGQSEKPEKALDIPELARALAAWMEPSSLSQAVMLGNSMGCQIIIECALQFPERVSKAVLVGPTTEPKRRSYLQQIPRLLAAGLKEPPSILPVVLSDYFRAGALRTIKTSRYTTRYPIEEKLSQVQIPLLVIRGGRDPIVSQKWVEKMVNLLPDAKLVVIPEAAHGVNYSHPHKLAEAVRSFIYDREG